MTLAIHLNE